MLNMEIEKSTYDKKPAFKYKDYHFVFESVDEMNKFIETTSIEDIESLMESDEK